MFILKAKTTIFALSLLITILFIIFAKYFILNNVIDDLSRYFESCFDNNAKPISKRAKTLFCIILTDPKDFFKKSPTVYHTWAQQCDNFKFVSMIPNILYNEGLNSDESIELDQPYPILQPKGLIKEDYKKLTDKMYLTFMDLNERYNNYDWYIKADHDTFVFVDNLRNFMASKSSENPLIYGYNLKTWHSGWAFFYSFRLFFVEI